MGAQPVRVPLQIGLIVLCITFPLKKSGGVFYFIFYFFAYLESQEEQSSFPQSRCLQEMLHQQISTNSRNPSTFLEGEDSKES